MTEYICAAFCAGESIAKNIEYIKAESQLDAMKKYRTIHIDPSNQSVVQTIGKVYKGNSHIMRDYVESIDWDRDLGTLIKPPIKWVNDIDFYKDEFGTRYVVGLLTGGVMEQPELELFDIEQISAENAKDAEEIYNKKHNCHYYYARCIGEINNENVLILYNDKIKGINKLGNLFDITGCKRIEGIRKEGVPI